MYSCIVFFILLRTILFDFGLDPEDDFFLVGTSVPRIYSYCSNCYSLDGNPMKKCFISKHLLLARLEMAACADILST